MTLINNNTNEDFIFPENFLNISNVQFDIVYEKDAYLSNIGSGIDKNSSGFYRLYMKDINGDMIVGRIFNVERYLTGKLVLSEMKGKFVRITFMASMFAGRMTLNVSTITLASGVDSRILAKVIGVIPKYNEHFEYLQNVITNKLGITSAVPQSILLYHNELLFEGRTGGCAEFCYLVLSYIETYAPLYSQVEHKAIVACFVYMTRYIPTIFDLLLKYDSIPMQEVIGILTKIEKSSFMADGLPVKEIAESALYGICVGELPDTTLGRILYRAWYNVLDTVNEKCISSKVPIGTIMYTGGKSLRRLW